MTILDIYNALYKVYSPQGWWPFLEDAEIKYHPLDYTFPKNEQQVFEVALGSILTQNTTFASVVKSLQNLNKKNCISSTCIKNMPLEELKLAIKPSGYFNQKAEYILNFIEFFESLEASVPSREELLHVKGIGEETADSILLFAYNRPEFKVDAYTKRLLTHLGLIEKEAKYRDIKEFMQTQLKEVIEDERELVKVYQEFHALIVRHAKEFYSKKPYGVGCFLS